MNTPSISFLRSITDPLTAIKKEKLLENMTGWTRLHRVLNSLSESDLLHMLSLELQGKCRPIIMSRIFTRFQNVRKERESRELYNVVSPAVAERVRKLSITRNKARGKK